MKSRRLCYIIGWPASIIGLLLFVCLSEPLAVVVLFCGVFLLVYGRWLAKPLKGVTTSAEVGQPVDAPDSKRCEAFRVTGTSHYTDSFKSLAVLNDDYRLSKDDLIYKDLVEKKVFQYTYDFNELSCLDEPDNPYDPKAISVNLDGMKVGYIKKGSTSHFRNLRSRPGYHIEAEVYGGKYKLITYDGDNYGMEKGELPYCVDLKVTYNQDHSGSGL